MLASNDAAARKAAALARLRRPDLGRNRGRAVRIIGPDGPRMVEPGTQNGSLPGRPMDYAHTTMERTMQRTAQTIGPWQTIGTERTRTILADDGRTVVPESSGPWDARSVPTIGRGAKLATSDLPTLARADRTAQGRVRAGTRRMAARNGTGHYTRPVTAPDRKRPVAPRLIRDIYVTDDGRTVHRARRNPSVLD